MRWSTLPVPGVETELDDKVRFPVLPPLWTDVVVVRDGFAEGRSAGAAGVPYPGYTALDVPGRCRSGGRRSYSLLPEPRPYLSDDGEEDVPVHETERKRTPGAIDGITFDIYGALELHPEGSADKSENSRVREPPMHSRSRSPLQLLH